MSYSTIANLEQCLSDLSYILHIIGKEFTLIMKNSDNENANILFENGIKEIKLVENYVKNLFDNINDNKESLTEQWYNSSENISLLQSQIENLRNAIDSVLRGNDNLVSECCI